MNRSGLLAAASLIRDGVVPREAIDTVRSRRPGALNHQQFVHLLQQGLEARPAIVPDSLPIRDQVTPPPN